MIRKTKVAAWVAVAAAGTLAGLGCQHTPTQTNDPNAAMKTEYEAGTGVSSSSYQAKPRLYSGDDPGAAAPATQPTR